MNNKGFTLVELLAVIIILSLLALLASTSVSKIVKDSKTDLYDTQIKLIQSAAEAWGADNLYDLPEAGTCKYLTLFDLKQYGLIDPEVKDPRSNELFPNELLIKISGEENKFGLNNITYEVNPNNVEECIPMFTCMLVNDSDKSNSITPGDKYQCKVKDEMEEDFEQGYYFYVLSHGDDGTTNLILDQNINSDGTLAGNIGVTQSDNATKYNLVVWNSSGLNTDGPVDAMQFLYNATKNWTNIPALNYTYNDKEYQKTPSSGPGYTSFVSSNGIATITSLSGTTITIGTTEMPLRVRMPIYSSVWNDEMTEKISETGEVADKIENNAYLYENLNGSVPTFGYWPLSSYSSELSLVWIVDSSGLVNTAPANSSELFGVRPVINLKI